MIIDYDSFTPLTSLVGGVMIGVAALLLMLMHGRVMGVSGILGGLLAPADKLQGDKLDVSWRLLFVIGVLAGPFALMALTGAPAERAAHLQVQTPVLRREGA